jgi:hypothetical protein
MDAMSSMQTAISKGLPLRNGSVNSDIKMFMDQPQGQVRFTFVKIKDDRIQSYASFVVTHQIDNLPCLSASVAVAPEWRQQKLATEIVAKSIDELRYELQGFQVKEFFVEALVSAQHEAAKKLATKLFRTPGDKIVDKTSTTEIQRYHICVQCF